MNDKRFIILFIMIIAVHRLSIAAVFTVENDTGYDIKLSGNWTGQLMLKSGASMRFDSGLQSLTFIRWLHKTEGRCFVQYNKDLNIPATALGGSLVLGKEGALALTFTTMVAPSKWIVPEIIYCAKDDDEWKSWGI